jgi:TPR repeat protein
LPGLLQQAAGPKPSAEAAVTAFYALNACKFRATRGGPPDAQDLAKPTQQDCAGISSADWDEAPRLLKLAADLGNERAQLAYARKEPLEGKSVDDFLQRPEELAEFKANANRYLVSASEAGNLDAMWFLSEALRTGDLMAKNLAAAYQYKYAIYRAGGYPQSITTEISNLESQMSPAEVKAAQDNAERFLVRCCKGVGAHHQ